MIKIAVLLMALAAGPTHTGTADSMTVMHSVRELLNAYSQKDIDAVLKRTVPDHPVMYGSDLSEVYTTPGGIRTLLQSDYQQWETSKFGELQHVNVRVDGATAAAFFDAPLSMNNHGQVLNVVVRFATVWRKIGGKWLLEESTNFVPSVRR